MLYVLQCRRLRALSTKDDVSCSLLLNYQPARVFFTRLEQDTPSPLKQLRAPWMGLPSSFCVEGLPSSFNDKETTLLLTALFVHCHPAHHSLQPSSRVVPPAHVCQQGSRSTRIHQRATP
jgi:hypothetical protein